MKRDIDYIVKDGEVLIVDEFTGRIMYGRRYNNGLHQAIEAKEGVRIADESRTLATITFQNYFRMYSKLSGMTGTAMTEEAEFQEIYKLDVITIPTNKPMIRNDLNDVIYKNEKAKFNAIVEEIKKSHEKGQPVLVGTISIENSEKISSVLKKEGIPHQVLNAKFHEKEASIIAQAGKYGAVTISTNMAGRGTDIILGGNSEFLAKQEMKRKGYSDELIEQANAYNETDNGEVLEARKLFRELEKKFDEEIKEEKEKVIEAGGLKIIGTERHESRRIDNQLRGRSGRQGDVGESKFFIGLDDNLMKIFGGDVITNIYDKIGADEDMPIEAKMLSNAVENAQKRVEGRNFSIRKNVLQYDDVMNTQREIIYGQRRDVLDGKNLKESILKMIEPVATEVVSNFFRTDEKISKEALAQEIKNNFGISEIEALKEENLNQANVISEIVEKSKQKYEEKEQELGEQEIRELERVVMLKVVDQKWMDHIDAMDDLKEGIGLRAYGQKDPVAQYRIEGFDMFDAMVAEIQKDVVKILLNIQKAGELKREQTAKITSVAQATLDSINIVSENKQQVPQTSDVKRTPVVNQEPKVGRNEPCPCGSGKKYKNCCGK